MNFKKLSTGAAVALCMGLLSSPAANANVILMYTGIDFTHFTPMLGSPGQPYTATDMVTATITLAKPLGDSFSGSVTPLEFSLADGVQTLSNNSAISSTTFDFTTDAAGKIINWDVDVFGTAAFSTVKTSNMPPSNISDEGLFQTSPGPFPKSAMAEGPPNTSGWTITTAAAPEPPTVSVLGAGLLGLGLLWWRRRQKLDRAQ